MSVGEWIATIIVAMLLGIAYLALLIWAKYQADKDNDLPP